MNLVIEKYDIKDNTPHAMATIIPIIWLKLINTRPAKIPLKKIAASKHINVNLKLDAFECDLSSDVLAIKMHLQPHKKLIMLQLQFLTIN